MVLELPALAVALAMDATAAAATRGLVAKRIRVRDVALTMLAFGGAQALMPLIGWLLGAALSDHVSAWDHWIAFALLVSVGARMVVDGAAGDGPGEDDGAPPFALGTILWLALATSIDAFAAGVTLPLLGAPLLVSVAVIGATTAVLSGAGLLLGCHLGCLMKARLTIGGGLLLIALGVKILLEHTLGG